MSVNERSASDARAAGLREEQEHPPSEEEVGQPPPLEERLPDPKLPGGSIQQLIGAIAGQLRPERSRLERVAGAFRAIRSIALTAAIFLAVASVLNEARRSTIEIEPFRVSEALAKRGITGEFVAHRVADQMTAIAEKAATSMERHAVSTGDDSALQGAVVPGTGLSLAAIVHYVRLALGWSVPHVSGELINQNQEGSLFSLIVRVRGRPAKTIAIAGVDDLNSETPFFEAARYVLRHTQPYILASYSYQMASEAALREIRFVLTNAPEDDDARAYNLWGILIENQNKFEEASRKYERALEIDPKAAYAWSNYGGALARLGRHEEAISKFERALEIAPTTGKIAEVARRMLGEVQREGEEALPKGASGLRGTTPQGGIRSSGESDLPGDLGP